MSGTTYRHTSKSAVLHALLLAPLIAVCTWRLFYVTGLTQFVFAAVVAGCGLYVARTLLRIAEWVSISDEGIAYRSPLLGARHVGWPEIARLEVMLERAEGPVFRVVSTSGRRITVGALLSEFRFALDDVVSRAPARAVVPMLGAGALELRILALDALVRRAARDRVFGRQAVNALREWVPPAGLQLPVSHGDVRLLAEAGTDDARALAEALVSFAGDLDRPALEGRLHAMQ